MLGSRSPNTVQCSRIWGLGVRLGADFEPVVEVVGHVVTAEGEHGHRVEAQIADLACCVPGLDQIS